MLLGLGLTLRPGQRSLVESRYMGRKVVLLGRVSLGRAGLRMNLAAGHPKLSLVAPRLRLVRLWLVLRHLYAVPVVARVVVAIRPQ